MSTVEGAITSSALHIAEELPSTCLPERRRKRELQVRLAMVLYFCVFGFAFDLVGPATNYLVGGVPLNDETFTFFLCNLCGALIAAVSVKAVRSPIWLAPICGVAVGSLGYLYVLAGKIGIITVVWHGGFGTFLFGAILTHAAFQSMQCGLASRVRDMQWTNRTKLVELRHDLGEIRKDLWALLKLLIQGVLGLAAITGVTMSILFRDGYDDIGVKMTAVKMATGFFICGASLYVFVAAPVLNLISQSWALDQAAVLGVAPTAHEETAEPEDERESAA